MNIVIIKIQVSMEGNEQIVMQSCENCDKQIQQSKINLHYSYCIRNVKKCGQCSRYYDINYREEHEDQFHINIQCKHCNNKFTFDQFPNHEKVCGPRVLLCAYCDQKVPQNIYESHIQSCGSRTVVCQICQRPVMSKDILTHEQICIMELCEIQDNCNIEGMKGNKRVKKQEQKPARSVAVSIFQSTKPSSNYIKSQKSSRLQPLDLTQQMQRKKRKVEKQKQAKVQKESKSKNEENEEKKDTRPDNIQTIKPKQIILIDDEEDQIVSTSKDKL